MLQSFRFNFHQLHQHEINVSEHATRGYVYTIHTNKYIERVPNKPTTTSMRDRQVFECMLAIQCSTRRDRDKADEIQ